MTDLATLDTFLANLGARATRLGAHGQARGLRERDSVR